jgi:glucose/mannose-6-phosphate isomerase
MQPRLRRLKEMLGNPLFESLIEVGQFDRIVFYGMGCSSVVPDIVKGFFLTHQVPIQVDVVNDYDLDWFVDREVVKFERTLTIIVCYSGWSVEPCLFYDAMRAMTGTKNQIVLSGGGKVADMCRADDASLIQYELRHADREYPLYHVQQFFATFLDLFHKLKITPSAYEAELKESVEFLKREFTEARLARPGPLAAFGERVARGCNAARSRERELVRSEGACGAPRPPRAWAKPR